MKGEIVFRRSFNAALDWVADQKPNSPLGSEIQMSVQLGVSRTTVRKVVAALHKRGLVEKDGTRTVVRLRPNKGDYFPRAETVATSEKVEKFFMEWMLRGDRKPGDYINGLALARQFSIAPGAIREYLSRFSRFGLIEKRPNSGWIFRGFTTEFALELSEIREMFEIRSALAFIKLPPEAAAWANLRDIETEHCDLLERVATRFHDFSDLDERFHRLINDASNNRFIVGFYDVISLIFHYHYQWNKLDEAERNAAAIREHLSYIRALQGGRPDRVERACRRHLSSARKTLLRSIS